MPASWAIETRPLVSADYVNDTRSSIVDGPSTLVTDGTLLKVYAWYDNEVGYACRMVDLANIVIAARAVMSGVRNYAIVTSSYFLFTLTDGAIRMLVLLHFYALGYTPFTLALLFLLYETAGIFANVGGGWLAVAVRHSAHAGHRPDAADRRAVHAVGAGPGLERGGVGRLGGRRARALPGSPRT